MVSPKLIPEVYTRKHIRQRDETWGKSRRVRTLRDIGDVIWLVTVARHVLDDADARCERRLQYVHLDITSCIVSGPLMHGSEGHGISM